MEEGNEKLLNDTEFQVLQNEKGLEFVQINLNTLNTTKMYT